MFCPSIPGFGFSKISILVNMGIFVVSEHMEKKGLIENITEESEATQTLLNETNRRYNEVLLVQEIGQTLSMIMDIDVSLRVYHGRHEKKAGF